MPSQENPLSRAMNTLFCSEKTCHWADQNEIRGLKKTSNTVKFAVN